MDELQRDLKAVNETHEKVAEKAAELKTRYNFFDLIFPFVSSSACTDVTCKILRSVAFAFVPLPDLSLNDILISSN